MQYELAKLRPSLRNLAIFNDSTIRKIRTITGIDKKEHDKMKKQFLKAMENKKRKQEYLDKFRQI